MKLPSLQRRLGGRDDQIEVGDERGGLVLRIVLAEGNEVDVLAGEERPNADGGGGNNRRGADGRG